MERRRSSDRWAKIIGVGLMVLVAELLVLLVAQFVPVGVDSDQNEQINRIPLEAAYDTREASQKGCQRTNPTRVAQVQAALDTATGNRARADAWRGLLGKFPTLDHFVSGQIKANEDEAEAQDRYAHTLVRAQRGVAKDPQDPDFAHRASVDCKAVYPIGQRGMPLPEPTKP